MHRTRQTHWRAAGGTMALAGVLAGALLVPIPVTPDDGRTAVGLEIRDRLPGWRVERIDPSWEGAYTVVASCGRHELGFQLVRGHGLPVDDAWIHPSDAYARERLAQVSDHSRSLVWYAERRRPRQLSCQEELARLGESPDESRAFD